MGGPTGHDESVKHCPRRGYGVGLIISDPPPGTQLSHLLSQNRCKSLQDMELQQNAVCTVFVRYPCIPSMIVNRIHLKSRLLLAAIKARSKAPNVIDADSEKWLSAWRLWSARVKPTAEGDPSCRRGNGPCAVISLQGAPQWGGPPRSGC